MKIEARAWAADASLNEDAAFHYLPSHCGGGHLRRCLPWGRGIRRHAPVLWLSVAVLVLSMSWMKACTSIPTSSRGNLRAHNRTYGHSRVSGAIASALWHRHATDESLP